MAGVVAVPIPTGDIHELVSADVEARVTAYCEGTCKVPREWWPIVKKYRELSLKDDPVSEARCNVLFDALLVLVR